MLAEQREDGRIAVSVQQQRVDGSWGRIYSPTRRLIPADLEPGRRLASSPIDLNVDDGTELLRHEQQQDLAGHAEFVAGRLNAAGDGTVICLNLDPRGEGLERYCDYLDAAYDGPVTPVSGADPDALERDLRAVLNNTDALAGAAVTSLAGAVIATRVATDLGLRDEVQISARGTILPYLMPNREADYCFITHGSPGLFWNFAYTGAFAASLHAGLDNFNRILESSFYADAEEHSALIRRCIEQGAVGIITSLADPDGVREAMAEADARGNRHRLLQLRRRRRRGARFGPAHRRRRTRHRAQGRRGLHRLRCRGRHPLHHPRTQQRRSRRALRWARRRLRRRRSRAAPDLRGRC